MATGIAVGGIRTPRETAPPRFLGRPLTPLAARRLESFRKNRRGVWSLRIIGTLFLLSLFAEFIANDKPILVQYEGALYAPVVASYPETQFGGVLETEADYKDRYVQDLIAGKGGFVIWPPVRFSYDTVDLYLTEPVPASPSARHWLGTDDTARDVFARLFYGFRLSMIFGIVLTAMSTVIGVAAGAVQGYFGGLTDLILQRVVEIWAGLPILFLLIILASVIEPNMVWLIVLLLLFSWMPLVGLVRAEFLRARNFDYVRAARAMGARNITIMRRHVLPNAMVATLTFLPFLLTGAITTLTALDFLGLGLPVDAASLGEVLRQGKNNLTAYWLGLAGFLTVAMMLTLIIFVSEAVRDAFDPRKTVG